MARRDCGAQLTLYGETYRCDRRKSHDGRHRAPYAERLHGADESGQYAARLAGGTVKWRRVDDRRA